MAVSLFSLYILESFLFLPAAETVSLLGMCQAKMVGCFGERLGNGGMLVPEIWAMAKHEAGHDSSGCCQGSELTETSKSCTCYSTSLKHLLALWTARMRITQPKHIHDCSWPPDCALPRAVKACM
jgi:hypothetical protein